MKHELLKIGPRVSVVPVVHGSGDFAWEVRRLMLQHEFDCLAVPLPESFQELVQQAILDLPTPGIVVQKCDPNAPPTFYDSDDSFGERFDDSFDDAIDDSFDGDDLDDDPRGDDGADASTEFGQPKWRPSEGRASYVPIDPCQPVIAAIRAAMGDRIPRRFIDLETNQYRAHQMLLPDAYALKRVPLEQYSAAVLPFLKAPQDPVWHARMKFMAWQLRELSTEFERILLVVSAAEWPWVRQAFLDPKLQRPAPERVAPAQRFGVDRELLYFLLGELPFITELYERARAELEDDANLTIDGIKELLITARQRYRDRLGSRAVRVTPRTLALMCKYIRNLTLMERGLSPQLVNIVVAAKQIVGDGYALEVLETARRYRLARPLDLPEAALSMNRIMLEDEEVLRAESRLPGPPRIWKSIELLPRPDEKQRREWQQKWNPFSQCSWPPEDELIENFRQSVFDRALQSMGADLAKTEKFTTSIKDGIDIRDTVRNWHSGDIYVKVLPPREGRLDCAVMLFDSPADPRDYPWRATWYAEHEEESTLAFFASNFRDEPVGPGICLANYGGAMFLYPPRLIPDIWTDPELDVASTLEERLLMAACKYSQCPQIALVSPGAPGPAWRRLARLYRKKWVHLPLSRFSSQTIQQLRMVHVLNGKDVRSYAANFIRRR